MVRTFIILGFALLGTMLACIYGIVHNQVTYTISPEFYNLIRFPKYSIPLNAGRWGVTQVAIINTWKLGVLVSFVISFIGLIHSNNPKIIRFTLQAFMLATAVTTLMSFIGYLFGTFNQDQIGKVADTIVSKEGFILVQTIHNFTYIGSLLGMFAAIYLQFFLRKRSR